ncbi:hypothetical protein [Lactobacillus terrae]|uniref:hypothetical protein n=1 Tax=Lactobacillus terrae TaxID=2269374 RepID=UPI0015D09F07|nr:hypothetical protein [Lactobacillus terrae]
MKTTKLVLGILMIVLSPLILIQGMAMGFINSVESNGQASGSGAVLMALAYIVSGIVYLATRKSNGLGGDIANAVILGLIGLMSITTTTKDSGDLVIWIWLGFIIGFGLLIWHILTNRNVNKSQSTSNNNNNVQNYSQGMTRSQMRSRKK